MVFLDPDNGLEAGSGACADKGPKYAFYDDLSAFSPAKTLVVYQHATRTGTFEEQARGPHGGPGDRLGLPQENLLAMRWRRVSPRAFIFALADPHRDLVIEETQGDAAKHTLGRAKLVPAGLLARV